MGDDSAGGTSKDTLRARKERPAADAGFVRPHGWQPFARFAGARRYGPNRRKQRPDDPRPRAGPSRRPAPASLGRAATVRWPVRGGSMTVRPESRWWIVLLLLGGMVFGLSALALNRADVEIGRAHV